MAPHMGPVLREHGPTKWINFALPANLKAGPLKPKIEAANAGEETANGQHSLIPHNTH